MGILTRRKEVREWNDKKDLLMNKKVIANQIEKTIDISIELLSDNENEKLTKELKECMRNINVIKSESKFKHRKEISEFIKNQTLEVLKRKLNNMDLRSKRTVANIMENAGNL